MKIKNPSEEVSASFSILLFLFVFFSATTDFISDPTPAPAPVRTKMEYFCWPPMGGGESIFNVNEKLTHDPEGRILYRSNDVITLRDKTDGITAGPAITIVTRHNISRLIYDPSAVEKFSMIVPPYRLLGPNEARFRLIGNLEGHRVNLLASSDGLGIPVKGIEDELRRNYSLLACGRMTGILIGPEYFGFRGREIARELMAEAIFAYFWNPIYFKTKAPNAAKRIRDYVNPNPRINRDYQFGY